MNNIPHESIAINCRLTSIASKSEIYIVCLHVDQDAIRIKYEITPFINSLERRGFPIVSWWGYARDDHGGDYQSAGGASGPSPDGEHTDGVLSFLPLPSKEVKRLDITMILILNGIETETKCEFSVFF
ncbi:hypothetical protein [aff. Roholtiella sp. LEGE 12411]|uniref:hypothetical protein n=1 Tax=aff. Roholtiella sp. LEGE 12411 TaxID=1828822 RepID=UPI0018800BE6|nr:hypothetical protein [aff. Roholtiella sp. LEGE 12411]MBE9037320.1 hypothetical protein [aff. Roholtiella sp. LEGE 12411]